MTEPRMIEPGDSDPPDCFLRLPEVARRTGFTVKTLRMMHYQQNHGEDHGHPPIPFIKMGRVLVVREKKLKKWMDAIEEKSESLTA